MNTQNFPRMIGTILVSFTVLIAGYTLIGHAFDHFLYPDEVFRKQIYSTATIDVVWFDLVLILTTLVIVAGWIFTYYSEQNRLRDNKERCNNLWLSFYALISREFYLMDIYSWMARSLLQLAARINVLLRWR
jgi:NADH-quinone oxidoreductase subunit L